VCFVLCLCVCWLCLFVVLFFCFFVWGLFGFLACVTCVVWGGVAVWVRFWEGFGRREGGVGWGARGKGSQWGVVWRGGTARGGGTGGVRKTF